MDALDCPSSLRSRNDGREAAKQQTARENAASLKPEDNTWCDGWAAVFCRVDGNCAVGGPALPPTRSC